MPRVIAAVPASATKISLPDYHDAESNLPALRAFDMGFPHEVARVEGE